ncbi:hypothetical protein FHG87_017205 [Trinorchestia longiramus]|nr:hypothetical protein FHG87_017205 [Trinorchestia longiramus]
MLQTRSPSSALKLVVEARRGVSMSVVEVWLMLSVQRSIYGKAVTQPGPEYIASDCIDGGRDSPPEADGNTSVCKASSIDDDTNKALLSTHMRQRLIKLYNKKRLHQSPARFFSPIKSPKKSVNVVSNRSVAQRFLFRHVNNLVPISGRVNEHDQYSDESYVPECESDQESDLDINDEFPCPALMVEVQIESGVSQNQSSLSGTESKIPVTAIAAMSTSVPLCVTRRNSSQPKKQDLKSQSPEASFDSDAVQETISNHMESVCDGIEGKSHDQDTNEDNVSTVCASKTGEASAVVLSKTVPPSCSTCCTSTRKLVESSNDPQILKANLTSNSNPEASGRSKRDNNCSRVYDQCKFGRGTGSLFEESSLSSSASARNSFKETTLDKETSVSKISLPIDVPVTDSGLASGHLLEADKCPSESQNSSLTSTTISDVHSSLPAHENYSMEILSKSDDHDNSEAPPTKHAHVSDLCDENFSSQPSSNPTTENADSTTVMIDKPVESLIDQFHDLKSNEFHSSLCSKNKSISSAPSSTLIANSELLKDHQPASSPSKKQMVELASTPEDVMSRSTRYSQLTGQPVVRLPLLTINDDSLEKLRMQGVKPCSVVSAFERLHRAEHLRSEVPDLSAEFAYFHVHQIFSAVIPKKYRKSNLFRCMLAHLTSLLRHGRLDGSFLDFEVVNHTYMGKIYCAWVKPVDSSELRDETQDASSSRTLALKGTTPADEGVTPADEGTTPADEGATPADEGATPADEETTSKQPPHASSQINTFEKSSYISSSSLKLSPEILDALNLKTKNLIVNGYVKESKSTGSLFPPETPFAKRRTSVIYVRYVKPFVPVSSERRMLVVRSLPQKLSNVAPQLSSSFVNSPVIASQLPQLPVNSTATSQILRLPLNSNAVLARRNAPNRNSVKVIRAFMFNPESGNSFVRAPTTNFGSALPERFSTLQTSSIQEIPGLRPNFSIPQSSNLPRSPPPPYSEAVQHPPPYYYSNQIRSFQTNYRNYAPRPIIAPSLLTRGHFVNDPNAGSTPNQGRTSFKYIRLDTNAHSDNTVNTIPSVSAFKPSGQIITSDL